MPDDTRCPLCEAPNRCGVAAGQTDCWCFTTTIPEDLRARVADEDQGRRCLCQACATRGALAELPATIEPPG